MVALEEQSKLSIRRENQHAVLAGTLIFSQEIITRYCFRIKIRNGEVY
jgi:hypothetical protein